MTSELTVQHFEKRIQHIRDQCGACVVDALGTMGSAVKDIFNKEGHFANLNYVSTRQRITENSGYSMTQEELEERVDASLASHVANFTLKLLDKKSQEVLANHQTMLKEYQSKLPLPDFSKSVLNIPSIDRESFKNIKGLVSERVDSLGLGFVPFDPPSVLKKAFSGMCFFRQKKVSGCLTMLVSFEVRREYMFECKTMLFEADMLPYPINLDGAFNIVKPDFFGFHETKSLVWIQKILEVANTFSTVLAIASQDLISCKEK